MSRDYNTMKLKLYIVSISLFVLCISKSHACDVINGSDIKFNHLGGYKYHVKYILYHQCVCRLGIMPTFTVSCAANSVTHTPKRTSIRDITPTCSSGQPPCLNGGYSGSRYGIEEHIFEDTIDFAQSPYSQFLNNNCCEVMFRVKQPWGLVGTTTSTTTYGGEAMMNLCAISTKGNHSPTLSNIPISFMCCNQPFTFNNGIYDNNDFDSLVYELDEPLSATFMPVTWISPLNKDIPLTPYCPPNPGVVNCRALPNAKPPRGFYFDKETGDMVLTPVKCDESGPVAMRVTEWRKDSATKKMIKIGYTRRDIYVTVVQCGDNNPPQIMANNKHSVCEGKKICFTITTFDSMMRPKQTVPDTITLTWNEAIKGATFRILDPTAREKQAEFCWQTREGDARNQAYSFTATAKDDACPRPAYTIKGFNIKVNPTARDKRKYDILDCGKLRFEALPKDTVNYNQKNYTYKFVIRDSTNSGSPVYMTYKKKDSFKFKRGGKYIIEHEINNPPYNCPSSYSDTVIIPPVLDISLAFGKDTFVCAGNSLTLEPIVAHGYPKFKYQWTSPRGTTDPKDTLSKFTLVKPTSSKEVILTLTDKFKCVDSDTILVHYQPNPIVNIGPDQRICTYQNVTLDAQNDDTMRYYWQPNGDSSRTITVNIAGKYIAKVIDHLGCNTSDTMELFVNDTVVAIAKPDREICLNDTLKVRGQRKPLGYTRSIIWKDINTGATMSSDSAFKVKITSLATRKYDMLLRVNQKGVICEDRDTFTLTVNDLPKFIPNPIAPRCYAEGAINLTLNKFATTKYKNHDVAADSVRYYMTSNPSWVTGGPVGKNTYICDFPKFITNAQVPKNGLPMTICFDYTDPKGCYNKDCKIIRLNPNPVVELKDGIFCQRAGQITLDKLVVKPFSKVGGIQSFRILSVPNGSGVDPAAIVSTNYSVVPNTTEMDPGMEGENEKTGDYVMEYCFKDALTGCQSCDTSTVTVIRLPEIQFEGLPKQCVNNPLLALDSFVKDRNSGKRFPDGVWTCVEYGGSRDMSNPNVSSKILNAVKQDKFFDPSQGAGQYLLKLTDISSGCPVADSTEILVNGLPLIEIDIPDTVCSSSAPFTLKNIQPSGANDGTWSGTGVTGRDFDPAISAKSQQYEGPVMIKYEYTNPLTGCTASDSQSLLIQSQPEIDILNTPPYQQCEGKVFTMESSSKWVKAIKWTSTGNGSFDNESLPNAVYTHGDQDTVLVAPALAGNVTLTVSTVKEGVCPPVKDDIQLIIEPYPQFVMPEHQVACEPALLSFSTNVNKPAGSPKLLYSWTFGNGQELVKSTVAAPQNIPYDTANRNWYDVKVTVHNQWGTADTQVCSTPLDLADYVRILPQPKAAFSSDPAYFTTVAFPKFKFFNNTQLRWGWEDMESAWTFDSRYPEDTVQQFNPIHSYPNDTFVYWVNLSTTYKYDDPILQETFTCFDSTGQPRKIGPDVTVFVPTAFSPEGTGPKTNNKFMAVVNGEKTFHIELFNRWGELLWTTDDKFEGWDGKFMGEEAQQDVYMWVVKVTAFDGEKYRYEGTVTLLR